MIRSFNLSILVDESLHFAFQKFFQEKIDEAYVYPFFLLL